MPIRVQASENPPFAFMVYEGESRCTAHLPVPAAVQEEAPAQVPDQFPPLSIEPEEVLTDNRFVVEESTTPKKAVPKKRTPAKKVQQRKRTKS